MTRISANDIRLPQNLPVPAPGRNGGSDFKAVLEEQTDITKADKVQDADNEPVSKKQDRQETENVLEREETAKVSDERREVSAENDTQKEDTDRREEMPDEEVMEAVARILAELQQQIQEGLQISDEDFSDTLTQMELTQTDLLDSGKLSDFVLGLTGAEDSLALLTDEGLLRDYREIMSGLQDLLGELKEVTGMELVEVSQVIGREQMQMPEMNLEVQTGDSGDESVTAGPFIEVTATAEGLSTGSDAEGAKQGAEDGMQSRDGALRHEPEPIWTDNQSVNDFQSRIMEASAARTSESTLAFSESTRQIMDQVLDYMKIQLQPEVSNLEMRLHPASLGTLKVQVEIRGEAVTAHFITENETVKNVLETQMIELKEQFQQQGMKVDAVEVSVQTQTFEQSFEQGRQAQQAGQENSRNRIRRINLGTEEDGAEVLQPADEAERIAVEMMTANGNTVDYMA